MATMNKQNNNPEWSSTSAYEKGEFIKYNETNYECISDVTAVTDSENEIPFFDKEHWQFVSINRILDYYGLQEAIKLKLNLNGSEKIIESLPLFISLAEDSYTTEVRAPAQRKTIKLSCDSSSRIKIPDDMLNVINLRQEGSSAIGNNYLKSRGKIEILAMNYEEYRVLTDYWSQRGGWALASISQYEAPGYWYDGEYFHLAPPYDEGTEFELVYYASTPRLGKNIYYVDANGNVVNKNGQTIDQWVAAGHTAGSFVPAVEQVLTNWFLAKAPEMVLYSSLISASAYLEVDDADLSRWATIAEGARKEVMYKVEFFDNHRAHHIEYGNTYSR